MGSTIASWVKSIAVVLSVFVACLQLMTSCRAAASKHDSYVKWVSPANGTIVALYTPGHRGINISGRLGDPVYAVSSGEVVYAGDGLRGYGNLIIIKHNSQYLSTYAYNKKINVKTGERVKRGQIIGEMGYKDKNTVMLYFELRRNGQAVNPLSIRGIMN